MQVHLIRGDDPVLVSQQLERTVKQLLGDADRSLVYEELTETTYFPESEAEIGPLVDAAATPPFLTDFRIVVGREMAVFTRGEQVGALVEYLADPLDSTRLVLVWERGPSAQRLGAPPKALLEAIKAGGGTDTKVGVGSGRAASAWLEAQLKGADLSFTPAAKAAIAERLGEQRSRVGGLVTTLEAAFGGSAKLDVDDVEPFLGEAGGVPPWELSDAIADGAVSKAVDLVRRMTAPGERHPLQITASLNTQYQRLLRLDGSGVRDEKSAAAQLGMKGSTFPAKKALNQSRQMGSAKIQRAIELLAVADLELRGTSAQEPGAIVELLAARLAALSRR